GCHPDRGRGPVGVTGRNLGLAVGSRRHSSKRGFRAPCSGPARALQTNAPAGSAGGGGSNGTGGSAADLEYLATAQRAGALERRLAVLHRDPLGVLDLDLPLVLDAIGLRHRASSSYGG